MLSFRFFDRFAQRLAAGTGYRDRMVKENEKFGLCGPRRIQRGDHFCRRHELAPWRALGRGFYFQPVDDLPVGKIDYPHATFGESSGE